MMDEKAIAIGTVVTVLLTGLAGAVVTVLTAIHKNRTEKEARAVDEYKGLVERQEKQIARLELQLDQQQDVIRDLHDEHANCQVAIAEIWGELIHSYETVCRHAAVLRELGRDPGPDSPRPTRPPRNASEAADFARRTTEQNTRLVKGIDPSARPPEEL